MADLHSILSEHRKKLKIDHSAKIGQKEDLKEATTSKIPDLFFDQVLTTFKLNRIEVLILMALYRKTWCRPNLYRQYGISEMVSLSEWANTLGISRDLLLTHLKTLESYEFIENIRAGQYFVRRYFTKELDREFGQNYNDFGPMKET